MNEKVDWMKLCRMESGKIKRWDAGNKQKRVKSLKEYSEKIYSLSSWSARGRGENREESILCGVIPENFPEMVKGISPQTQETILRSSKIKRNPQDSAENERQKILKADQKRKGF